MVLWWVMSALRVGVLISKDEIYSLLLQAAFDTLCFPAIESLNESYNSLFLYASKLANPFLSKEIFFAIKFEGFF